MLRTISAAAIGVTMLGATALPASAAPASHPETHSFTLPKVTGIKVWGSYYQASGKAHVTACMKETASDVFLAVAVFTAFNGNGKHTQDLDLKILSPSKKQVCKSMVTSDTAAMHGDSTSATTNGKSHFGKPKRIYSPPTFAGGPPPRRSARRQRFTLAVMPDAAAASGERVHDRWIDGPMSFGWRGGPRRGPLRSLTVLVLVLVLVLGRGVLGGCRVTSLCWPLSRLCWRR
jgi:hypothetical protein